MKCTITVYLSKLNMEKIRKCYDGILFNREPGNYIIASHTRRFVLIEFVVYIPTNRSIKATTREKKSKIK